MQKVIKFVFYFMVGVATYCIGNAGFGIITLFFMMMFPGHAGVVEKVGMALGIVAGFSLAIYSTPRLYLRLFNSKTSNTSR